MIASEAEIHNLPTQELKWNMEMLSITCCQGDNQLLMWNFTKEENERVTAYHWFFNEKTLICLDSETIGFHVTNLYKGRVERIGTLGIRLKNVSLTDTGEYTLYVKLDPEIQRNLQGISLTVVGHHLPSQCKPIITRQSNSIISCSTPCERSSLSPEWIINGTNETVGIGPYLTVDPHLTSEHLLCCLRSLTCHNDDQFKLCTQNHISFADNIHVNSKIEISTNTATQHNGTVMMTILFILGAIVLLVLPAVVIFYWKRRHKLSRRLRDGNQNDNNVNKICLDADQVLMQNLEGSREAAKDTSDTDSHYEDASSANEVFALSGCNAELEWTQQETYLDLFAFSLNVFNANGIKIAEKKDMTCKSVIDSSVFCEARNTSGEEWRFFVVLINVTQANSGKYTGQIQTGRNYAANITTELKVIDKPLIKEAQKPILHEPLSIRCNVDGEFEDLIYYWAFNGTDLNYTERIYAESANLTFERLTLADKFSFVSCRVCSSDNCCIESDTYSPDPYSDTRVPSKLGETGGYLRVLHGLGLVIAAIMLLVTGSLLLVTLRRKLATRVSDTHPLHHSFDGHFNTEWSQRITEPNQTVPAEQDNALNCAQIQHYQKANSLQTRKGNTQSACNPVKKGLSVQTVMHLSHTNTMLAGAKDSTNKLFNSDKDHWPCNFECTSDRIGLNESYPVIQQDKNMCDDERTTGATCICLANSGCGRFEPELQESQYTTIDEAALSVYDYAGTNHHGDKIHEDNSNIDVGNFIYDYAALPPP